VALPIHDDAPVRPRHAVHVAIALALFGACSSSSTRATSTTAPPENRCNVYARMAAADRAIVARATTDWVALRRALVAGNERAEAGYRALARSTEGSLPELHADALRVAGFMPRSRELVARSRNLAAYQRDLVRLPGDARVRAATARINADALKYCGIQFVTLKPSAGRGP
jgi:hypothetical protein